MTKTTVFLNTATGGKVEFFDVEPQINPQIGCLQIAQGAIDKKVVAIFPFQNVLYFRTEDVAEKIHEVLEFQVVK